MVELIHDPRDQPYWKWLDPDEAMKWLVEMKIEIEEQRVCLMKGKDASKQRLRMLDKSMRFLTDGSDTKAQRIRVRKKLGEELKMWSWRLYQQEIVSRRLYPRNMLDRLDSYIQCGVRAWSTQFTDSMHKRLPRELRDMVYENLLNDTECNNRGPFWPIGHLVFHSVCPTGCPKVRRVFGLPDEPLCRPAAPYYVRLRGYLAPAVATEVAEFVASQQIASFRFCLGFPFTDRRWLEKLLRGKVFHTDLPPSMFFAEMRVELYLAGLCKEFNVHGGECDVRPLQAYLRAAMQQLCDERARRVVSVLVLQDEGDMVPAPLQDEVLGPLMEVLDRRKGTELWRPVETVCSAWQIQRRREKATKTSFK